MVLFKSRSGLGFSMDFENHLNTMSLKLHTVKEYLYVNIAQRKGIIYLCLLITSYAIARSFYIKTHLKPLPEIVLTASGHTATDDEGSTREMRINKIDLNKTDVAALTKAGVRQHVAERIIKYRNVVGGFKDGGQLRRIYGISPEETDLLQKIGYLSGPSGKGAGLEPKRNNQHARNNIPNSSSDLRLSDFDPNTVTSESLLAMGLPQKAVKGLINFRNAGAVYKSSADVQKVYAISPDLLDKMLPYMKFDETKEEPKSSIVQNSSNKKPAKIYQMVDINRASMEDLDQLPGIGPGYARRILNWRDKLGGFATLEQIKETYHLPDSVFKKIEGYILFKTPPYKININTADEAALSGHFYINKKEASIICAYRNNHGPFRKITDLKKVIVLDDAWIARIEPYLAL